MFEKKLPVLEPRRWVHVLAKILAILGVIGIGLWCGRGFSPGMFGVHLLAFGALIGVSGRTRTIWRARRRRELSISGHGVLADGVLVAHRDEIIRGYYQPRTPDAIERPPRAGAYRSSVRILGRWHRILAEIECEPEESDAILAELGLAAGQVRATFRGAGTTVGKRVRATAIDAALLVAIGVVGGMLTHFEVPGAGLATITLGLLAIAVVLWPSTITIGIDGILLRRLGRERFIPMARIRSVGASGWRAIELVLDDGTVHLVHMSSTKNQQFMPRVADLEHRDAVLARVVSARDAQRLRGPAPDVARTLARGPRSAREWVAALRELRSGGGGYRAAALREAELWETVENSAVDEDARAGAALLLRPTLDSMGKQRVRIAAGTTASPKLRVALDRAADATSEAEVEAALEELAAQRVRRV